MATYYTALTGNDSNPGTLVAPFRTVSHGVSLLTPGDTLLIRGGTYNEAISNPAISGTSWNPGEYIRIAAYSNEIVWLKRSPAAGPAWTLEFQNGQTYIEIDHINVDTRNAVSPSADIGGFVVFGSDAGGAFAAHHCRWLNSEYIGNSVSGTTATSMIAIDFNGHDIGFNEARNITIHGGAGDNFHYGFYVHSNDNILDGLDIYDMGWSGGQIYNGPAPPERNIIRNCKFHNMETGSTINNNIGGFLLSGNNNVAYNNIVYDINTTNSHPTSNAAGIVLYNGDGNALYNNVVVGVNGDAVQIGAGITNCIIQNNIFYNNTIEGITNFGGTIAVNDHNSIGVNPNFVDYAGHDYHLTALSVSCIDKGVTIATFNTDRDGNTRPQGSAWDIGAYELGGSGGGGGHTPTTYYLSTSGNNVNDGKSLGAPWRSFTYALPLLQAGDTLEVRGGTYVESVLQPTKSGTDWVIGSGAITVRAYNSETVFLRPASGAQALILSGIAYNIWSGIQVDGINLSTDAVGAVHITSSHHIRYTGVSNSQRCEVKNAFASGITINDTGGHNDTIELLKLKVYSGARSGTEGSHGLYFGGTTNLDAHILAQDIEVYGFTGIGFNTGIQCYSADQSNLCTGITIDRCNLHHNNYGSVLANANAGITFTNTLVHHNTYAGVAIGQLDNCPIYNNTIDGNGTWGLDITVSQSCLVKNNAITNNVSGPVIVRNGDPTSKATLATNGFSGNGNSNSFSDQNSLSTETGTLTSNPLYVGASAGDYRMDAASPYVDTGLTLLSVTTDYTGVSRPQGAAYDIGAYDIAAGTVTPPPPHSTGSMFFVL